MISCLVPEIRQDFRKNDVQTIAYGAGPQDRHHCFILPYAESPEKPPIPDPSHPQTRRTEAKAKERRPVRRRSLMSIELT